MRLFLTVFATLAVSCSALGQTYAIQTFAGGGSATGDNIPATSAKLNYPYAVAADSAGNLYIADTTNNVIRKVSNGVITTAAGNGTNGYGGDNGPATSAQLASPLGVAVDAAGNLYIADRDNQRIRRVSNGVITSVAGNGTQGFSGDDGPATSAQLYNPWSVAVDGAGNLYIADRDNHRIREVSNGVISTVAGSGWHCDGGGLFSSPPISCFSGDNGPATSAWLYYPEGVAADFAGNLYIADTYNQRIRGVSNGVITTVAGQDGPGFGGDNGPATGARFYYPTGVAVDGSGSLYIADSGNSRIREVSNGVITTAAGNGTQGFSGDNGPAASAQLNEPFGVAVDVGGNLYVADTYNGRIRVLIPSGAACPASVSPLTLSVPASGGNLTIAIQTGSSCAWAIQSLPTWITYSGSVVGTGPGSITLSAAANSGETRTATVSIAGALVSITQPASSLCAYALSFGGQTFPVAGGTGSIGVTAANGCSWDASSAVDWVAFIGSSSGTGSGAVTYQVAANAGSARSGVLTIAGLPFTVEQASATVTGLAAVGSMAQLAAGGLWNTTITLINTGAAAAQARLNFFDDSGNPLPLPLTFPQAPSSAPLLASTLDRTLSASSALVIQTAGADSQTTLQGWGQLLTNGSISGFAVFGWKAGNGEQEAIAPLETRNPGSFVLWFDNTGGGATGVALANVAAASGSAGAIVRDANGVVLSSGAIALAGFAHTAFMLADRFPAAANRSGTVEFQTPAGGEISVLAIRANPSGAITSVPPVAK